MWKTSSPGDLLPNGVDNTDLDRQTAWLSIRQFHGAKKWVGRGYEPQPWGWGNSLVGLQGVMMVPVPQITGLKKMTKDGEQGWAWKFTHEAEESKGWGQKPLGGRSWSWRNLKCMWRGKLYKLEGVRVWEDRSLRLKCSERLWENRLAELPIQWG